MSKAKSNSYVFIFLLAIVLIMGAIYLYKNKTQSFTYYKNFGITIPNGFSWYGIDVSHHEGDINWDAALAMRYNNVSINFVIGKATEGTNFIDKNYIINRQQLNKKGVLQGAYHYLKANQNGITQANFFIANAQLQKNNIIPVLDVEELSGASPAELESCVKDWLTTVEDYYHVKPIVYANAAFYNQYLVEVCKNYPLWVAHYTSNKAPTVNKTWQIWQHSEQATINGINDLVDFNVYQGDSVSFSKLLLR
jgi:lysozyme